MQDFTPENLRHRLPVDAITANITWWVGLSGGLDSTVLLYALRQLDFPVRLVAVHINHQLSPNADAWQEHCRRYCEQLGVEFFAEKVMVKNVGKGIEDAAREERYATFSRYLGPGDFLFTAHHSNDQAETLLLRLMRGTGPRGLAAIAQQRAVPSGGKLCRPLLDFPRVQLEAYAHDHQLVWINDESNHDDAYDRNFLRNHVLPLLHGRWPAFMRKWQQTAELCAQQEALLDEFAKQDLDRASVRLERVGLSLDLGWLKTLSRARRQHLLRYWLRSLRRELPEAAHLEQLEQQLFNARIDACSNIRWGAQALRPHRDRLYLLPADLPGLSVQYVKIPAAENPGGRYLRGDLSNLEARVRVGGERCKPVGRHHSQTLKKLLQEAGVEPWLRDGVPLIFSEEEWVAVGDLWINDGFAAPAGTPGIKITWREQDSAAE